MSRALPRSRAIAVAVAALTVLGTGACVGGGDATPSSSTASSTSPSPSPELTPAEPLTEDEATGVLPAVGNLPEGWEVTTRATLPDERFDGARTEPEICIDTLLRGSTWGDIADHRKARSARAYTPDGGDTKLFVVVESFDVVVPDALLDEAGAATGQCGRYRYLKDGADLEYRTSSLGLPVVGEKSVSLRRTTRTGTLQVITDLLVAKDGSTLVTVEHLATSGEPDVRITERMARTALVNLETL